MTLNLIFAKPISIEPSQNIQTLLSASLNTVRYFYTHSFSFFLSTILHPFPFIDIYEWSFLRTFKMYPQKLKASLSPFSSMLQVEIVRVIINNEFWQSEDQSIYLDL